ncbi:STAS domain-containing protein [Ilumatobacter sp.]|uniref:STAS domain-containing protein n=1 Tax=Ilumatobacter sp. TaxID=1967498 RepID=UPI003B52E9AA
MSRSPAYESGQLRFVLRAHGRRLEVSGDLDTITAPDVEDALAVASAGVGDVVVDVTHLDVLAAAGVSVLADTARSMVGRGRLIVSGPSDTVRRVLEITDLTRLVDVRPPDGLAPGSPPDVGPVNGVVVPGPGPEPPPHAG